VLKVLSERLGEQDAAWLQSERGVLIRSSVFSARRVAREERSVRKEWMLILK